jgi:hypothetical protein
MQPSRVAIIGADWPEYEKYCPNFTGMQLGLEAMGIEHKLFSCRPVLNIEALIAYQPDFIIYGLLDMVKTHQKRLEIRNALPNAKIVMWYGDLRNEETGQIRADMSEIDGMFVSNAAQNAYYESIWRVPFCRFLPLGSPLYTPIYKCKYDLDFIFVGATITGKGFMERARIIMDMRQNGLRVIDAPAQRKPELRAKILKDLPDLYYSAKITLDWSHFTDIEGYTSNRFWIITGSGGFALTKRWPGCEAFYPEGTRAYFDTKEEALELRDYYLSHPEEREKIRAAGYAHAKNHTYQNRFATMFSEVYGTGTKDRLQVQGLQTPRTSVQEGP